MVRRHTRPRSSTAERLAFNQGVAGSIPAGGTRSGLTTVHVNRAHQLHKRLFLHNEHGRNERGGGQSKTAVLLP